MLPRTSGSVGTCIGRCSYSTIWGEGIVRYAESARLKGTHYVLAKHACTCMCNVLCAKYSILYHVHVCVIHCVLNIA